MRRLRRCFLWYALLTKRLLRRPGYLAVLLLVPLLTLALSVASRQESGVVTVALACEDPADPASAAAVERLLSENSILCYLPFADTQQAQDAVIHGRADAAWIFRTDTSAVLEDYASGGRGAAVTVVEREDNVFLRLSREKLYAALYPELSYDLFRQFVRQLPGAPEKIGDETLRDYYASGAMDETVVRFVHAGGGELQNADSYLITPLRGLLSLLIVLSGLADRLYCFKEEREERFVWLCAGKRRMLPFFCHLTAILPMAAAVLAALAVAGVLTDPGYELALMLCFSLATAAFCELLGALCRTEAQLGALIPVLMAAMLALCPVFFDLELLRPLQYLFPPYYYLSAVYAPCDLLWMLLYTVFAAGAALAISYLGQRRA